MSHPLEETSDVHAQARAWLTYLYGNQIDEAGQEAFRRWLHAAPENAPAYARAESIWRALPLTRNADEVPAPRASTPLRKPSRRRAAGVAAAAAVCAAAAVGVMWYDPVARGTYATRIGEIRTLRLTDGTEITLGPASKLSTQISRASRTVSMSSGQAFFAVARDEDRPFVVASAATEVRVLGTRFDMRRSVQAITISVAEGTVEVADRPDPSAPEQTDEAKVVLEPGQRIRATLDGALEAPTRFDPTRADAWRDGRLAYVDALLSEVVDDINRYSTRPIEFADERAGRIRVTATFRVRDALQLLSNLAATNGLVVRSEPERIVLSLPAP